MNGELLSHFGGIAVDVESGGQVLVKDFYVIAAVEVVVDEHLPVALHVVAHLLYPSQTRLGLGLENPDLVLDAFANVIERRSFEIFVFLKIYFYL